MYPNEWRTFSDELLSIQIDRLEKDAALIPGLAAVGKSIGSALKAGSKELGSVYKATRSAGGGIAESVGKGLTKGTGNVKKHLYFSGGGGGGSTRKAIGNIYRGASK